MSTASGYRTAARSRHARAAALRDRISEVEGQPVLAPLTHAMRRRVCELELAATIFEGIAEEVEHVRAVPAAPAVAEVA